MIAFGKTFVLLLPLTPSAATARRGVDLVQERIFNRKPFSSYLYEDSKVIKHAEREKRPLVSQEATAGTA